MRTLFTGIALIFYFNLSIAQVPINDICANAIQLEFSDDCRFNTLYDNTNATTYDPDVGFDPVCDPNPGYNDVWFYLEMPSSGTAQIDFLDRYYVADAEVYSGSCSNLQVVFSENGYCTHRLGLNTIWLNRSPGEILYIRVFTEDIADQGEYKICAVEYEDMTSSCTNPIELNISNECDAVFYASTNARSLNNHWYSIEIPSHIPYVNIDSYSATLGGPFIFDIKVYENSCDNLELVAKGNPIRIDNNGRPNQRYLIHVGILLLRFHLKINLNIEYSKTL